MASGKGTQCALLIAEFGGDVAGTSDGTVLPADAQRVVTERHPPLPRGGLQRRFGAVHISVGALLRAEMQRHKAGQGSTKRTTATTQRTDAFTKLVSLQR